MTCKDNDWIVPPGDAAQAIIGAAELARAATRFWFGLGLMSLGVGLMAVRSAERAAYEHRGPEPATIPLGATLFFTPGP